MVITYILSSLCTHIIIIIIDDYALPCIIMYTLYYVHIHITHYLCEAASAMGPHKITTHIDNNIHVCTYIYIYIYMYVYVSSYI